MGGSSDATNRKQSRMTSSSATWIGRPPFVACELRLERNRLSGPARLGVQTSDVSFVGAEPEEHLPPGVTESVPYHVRRNREDRATIDAEKGDQRIGDDQLPL